MPFTLVENDITKMRVDAIVNAANPYLRSGGGVCGAIFHAAGRAELTEACRGLAPVKTGGAVITPAFNLPSKYVIHAVGPVYDNYPPEESARYLYSAYKNSLELAKENGCESIAFPLISGGIYGYPKEQALQVAATAVRDFLDENEMNVYLAFIDKRAFVISESRLREVGEYISSVQNNIDEPHEADFCLNGFPVEDAVKSPDEPFNRTLLKLIDARGKTDAEVYKKANIDRKLFSKIRAGDGCTPSKRTALALAVSLELDLNETRDFLARAGYALSPCKKSDVIIQYFIVNGRYDIFEINEVLFARGQPLLGG